MGEIVGAAIVSHQPDIMALKEFRQIKGCGRDTSMVAGLGVMKKAIAALNADTIVIFDTHWFTASAHVLAGAPLYRGIHTSDECPTVIFDHHFSYAGAPDLAKSIAEFGRDRKVPVVNCKNTNIAQHDPTISLIHHLRSHEKILSVGICQSAGARNFIDFGDVIAKAVQKTAGRVILLASGGLSHSFWPLDEIDQHMGYSPDHVVCRDAKAMDEKIIELWQKGNHAEVIAMYPEYRKYNPEGFFGHYLMMVGALGGASCRIKGMKMSKYESALGSGQIHMWFDTAA